MKDGKLEGSRKIVPTFGDVVLLEGDDGLVCQFLCGAKRE